MSGSSTPPPRVTVRMIALRAKVHYTTVARALKNHPALPLVTRTRIQALAKEMGYVPDPMVSALSVYRVAHQSVRFHGKIAWINGYPPTWQMSSVGVPVVHQPLFEGACAKAKSLGYVLEAFRVGDERTPTADRLDRVLAAQGVRNLIVAPQMNPESRLALDWPRYSALSVSLSVSWPRLHLVTNDHFANLMIAAQALHKKGYRRIGLMLEMRLLEITRRRWLGGFLATRQEWPVKEWLEPFLFENPVVTTDLRRWWRKWRPEAVVTEYGFWRNRLSPALGLQCPDSVGIALVSIPRTGPPSLYAGIKEQANRIGAIAVEQLVRMEHTGERGIPDSPFNTLVAGEWQDGTSLSSASRSAAGEVV